MPSPDLSIAFCEREYNNRALVPDHPKVFERWRAAAAKARKALGARVDIAYGDAADETLDFFPATAARPRKPTPLLTFIHGGYWRSLDKADHSWIAAPFVARGISVAMLNYGLAPTTPIEEQVRQMLRGHAWLYRNAQSLHIDPRAIFATGHSAGAHLTAMMLAAQWDAYAPDLPPQLVRGGVLVSGIFELEPLLYAPFLNDDLQLTPERVAMLSPARMPMPASTRIVACAGGDESSEFIRQTQLVADVWPQAQISFVAAPGLNHFTVCNALAQPGHPLFEATWALIGSR